MDVTSCKPLASDYDRLLAPYKRLKFPGSICDAAARADYGAKTRQRLERSGREGSLRCPSPLILALHDYTTTTLILRTYADLLSLLLQQRPHRH